MKNEIQKLHAQLDQIETQIRKPSKTKWTRDLLFKGLDGEFHHEGEPDEGEILADLLPRNISVQIFRALLENAASEQGARMSAMDNATRNAGEMIDKLTIDYNRQRQAQITTELIEIISGVLWSFIFS